MAEGLQVKASGTIRPSRFVTLDTSENNSVLESNASDTKIVGISMEGFQDAPQSGVSENAAEDGDALRIHTFGEVALLELDASGCTAGDFLKPDNNGLGDVAGSTDTAAAIALETGAASEKVQVLVLPPTYVA